MDLRTALSLLGILAMAILTFRIIARPVRTARRIRQIEDRLNWQQGSPAHEPVNYYRIRYR